MNNSIRPNRHLTRGRRRRAGFTLLELILVMTILVVLAGLAGTAIFSIQGNAYAKAATVDIASLSKACKLYRLDVGVFPSTLDGLYTKPAEVDSALWQGPYMEGTMKKDPWSRPYKYSPGANPNEVSIVSAGPDGQMGTADDVPNNSSQ
jgi:general secretion pathway protein G